MDFAIKMRTTLGITALSMLTVGVALGADPQFSNQTVSAGVAHNYHKFGSYQSSQYSGGGSVGDFNNDGYQDMILLSGGGNSQRDRLFINNGDGTFTNEALAWGIGPAHMGKGTSVADYNNDGWLDIYVTSAGPVTGPSGGTAGKHILYRNNGDNTFTNVAIEAGVNQTHATSPDGFGSCWGDYDLDGDLDLFVTGIVSGNTGDTLFRNNGDGTFTDITDDIGMFVGVPSIYGFSPRLIDMDGDWYPDLPYIGDFGTSRYFKNDANPPLVTFTEMTNAANMGQEENGMGGTAGDFNNDGLIDVYATSIYSPGIGWTGNKLYINQGNHFYSEVSGLTNTDDGGYGWGAVAVDFNHDTMVDVAETNGDAASFGTFFGEQAYLWINNGGSVWDEVAIESGFVHNQAGRSLCAFDYDNDGDQDMFIVSYSGTGASNGAFNLYRNDLDMNSGDANWLRVFVDTSADDELAPNGYGSRVYVEIGETTLMRSIDGGNSYLGISELSAHFGLGSATTVDEVRIEFHNGTIVSQSSVAVNQTISLAVGDETPAIVSSEPADGSIDARQPSNPDGSDPAGWDAIEITFDGAVAGMTAAEFELTENGGDGIAPGIESVSEVDTNVLAVIFDSAIEPGAWTTLTVVATGETITLGSLPADVNGDGTSGAGDVLALIDALNGQSDLPLHSTDIDRSGVATAADVLRTIDLLNGTGVYDVWNGQSLP